MENKLTKMDGWPRWLSRLVRRFTRRPVFLIQNIGGGCGWHLFWEHSDGTREPIRAGLAAPGDVIPIPAKTMVRWVEAHSSPNCD
jgi:hypothetical protein